MKKLKFNIGENVIFFKKNGYGTGKVSGSDKQMYHIICDRSGSEKHIDEQNVFFNNLFE